MLSSDWFTQSNCSTTTLYNVCTSVRGSSDRRSGGQLLLVILGSLAAILNFETPSANLG